MYERRRSVITGPGNTLFTCTPSVTPRSANAFAIATIAAFTVATAAKPDLGVWAELPDVKITDPFDCLSDSHA